MKYSIKWHREGENFVVDGASTEEAYKRAVEYIKTLPYGSRGPLDSIDIESLLDEDGMHHHPEFFLSKKDNLQYKLYRFFGYCKQLAYFDYPAYKNILDIPIKSDGLYIYEKIYPTGINPLDATEKYGPNDLHEPLFFHEYIWLDMEICFYDFSPKNLRFIEKRGEENKFLLYRLNLIRDYPCRHTIGTKLEELLSKEKTVTHITKNIIKHSKEYHALSSICTPLRIEIYEVKKQEKNE